MGIEGPDDGDHNVKILDQDDDSPLLKMHADSLESMQKLGLLEP